MSTFVEKDCDFTHEGKTFEAGGSYLLPCTDGKVRGAVYIVKDKMTDEYHASTWHGEHLAFLDTMTVYRGNFCRMCRVTFTYDGRKFIGEYCPDWADACKVRSTK